LHLNVALEVVGRSFLYLTKVDGSSYSILSVHVNECALSFHFHGAHNSATIALVCEIVFDPLPILKLNETLSVVLQGD
jgi:hypothetical protein